MILGLVAVGGATSFPLSSVPPITPGEFGVEALAHYIWVILAKPEVVALLVSGLGGLVGILLRNRHVKKWRMERAVEFLAAGVRETYEEYVREVKRANADGKLTESERNTAMEKAIEKGRKYCREHGYDLFKAYAKEFVPVIVERIIGTQKAFGRANIPFPPLPELELR